MANALLGDYIQAAISSLVLVSCSFPFEPAFEFSILEKDTLRIRRADHGFQVVSAAFELEVIPVFDPRGEHCQQGLQFVGTVLMLY